MEANTNKGKAVFAIIGDPISQAKSPVVFNNYFREHQIDAEMVPFHVHPSDFENVLAGIRKIKNFAGAIVTIPHKHAAFNIARHRGPNALATKMANVLVPVGSDSWSCEMFDGVGLVNALIKKKIKIEGSKTLVIGAGGAGTAIAVALQNIGKVGQIGISDINDGQAKMLVGKLENAQVADANQEAYALIVNASPVGMGTTELPIDPKKLKPGTIVCDAVMHPPQTQLLVEAGERGCIMVEGIEMLLGQLEPILNFLGVEEDSKSNS